MDERQKWRQELLTASLLHLERALGEQEPISVSLSGRAPWQVLYSNVEPAARSPSECTLFLFLPELRIYTALSSSL